MVQSKSTARRCILGCMSTGTVLVGSEAVPLMIHTGLVCHRSTYFQGALNGRFVESKSRSIKLDDEDGGMFLVMIHWLYSGKIRLPIADERRWIQLLIPHVAIKLLTVMLPRARSPQHRRYLAISLGQMRPSVCPVTRTIDLRGIWTRTIL